MADFTSLNGYNVKDIKSRSALSFPSSVNFNYMARDVYWSGKNFYSTMLLEASPSSITYVDNNNYIVCYDNLDDDGCVLRKYNANISQISKTGQKIDLGLGNSMAYDKENDEVYICPVMHRESGAETTPYLEIVVVDPEELTIKRRIQTDINFLSITKDVITGKWYGCDENNIYEINDIATMSHTTLFSIGKEAYQTIQQLVAYDSYLYLLLSNPNSIAMYDLKGNIKNVPIDYSYGPYQVGEAKGLTINSDADMLLVGAVNSHVVSYVASPVFKTNLFKGPQPSNNQYAKDSDINVRKRTTYYALDVDGTVDKPFNRLVDIEQMLDIPYLHKTNIKFWGDGNFLEEALYISGKSVNMGAYDYTTTAPPGMGNLILRDCPNVTITNMQFNRHQYNDYHSIDAVYSNVKFISGYLFVSVRFIYSNLELGENVDLESVDLEDCIFEGYDAVDWVMPGATYRQLSGYGMVSNGGRIFTISLPLGKRLDRLTRDDEARITGSIYLYTTTGLMTFNIGSQLNIESIRMDYEQNTVLLSLSEPTAIAKLIDQTPIYCLFTGMLILGEA